MDSTLSENNVIQFNGDSGITEAFDLLHIYVEGDETDHRRCREDVLYSRNALRKQRHWEKRQAAKKSKRKEEKIRRKLNREKESGPDKDVTQLTKRVINAITKERLAEAKSTGPKLCVDLSMTDCMSDKEVSRLAGQIRRLYGSNRKASRPFHLLLTDLEMDSRLYKECVRKNDGFVHYQMDVTEKSCLELFPRDNIIYLTPDAEEALESVETDMVYVLGGLVDESIQKISYQRARECNVRTARLPVEECMIKKDNPKNFHSKILAINQVFDILLTFCDTGSWSTALETWFPLGKGYVVATEALPCPSPVSGT
ncbi:tRNA methyltransferase 10 homolog B isoform 2-T2 [Aplochiton taeniatus]